MKPRAVSGHAIWIGALRGSDLYTEGLFTMQRLDDFVPANHPLRRIREMVNEALARMDELLSQLYEADVKGGRPSVTLRSCCAMRTSAELRPVAA